MILLIDNSEIDEMILSLFDNDYNFVRREQFEVRNDLSEKMLINIDTFLNSGNLKKENLNGIVVNQGPGSYTGLRISLATANLIACSLNIPVIGYCGRLNDKKIADKTKKELKGQGKKFENAVVPFYKNPPHITKNKHC
ncbi:MAG: tRNA (adenosine(37)-N6)-threonylcarbamoyltransferase complex dimerization subunit type 1 TsaB [Patescibacteria group bacterium]